MRKILSLILMLAFIGGSLILPGCEVDYYQEPEDEQGSGSSLFEDGVTVPAGFDWATMRTVNVTVKVDDQYNGNYYYTVELFDSNPLFDENATLLGKGVAKKDINFKTTIALAADIETVYIKQIDPTGREKVTAASFGNGADISVTFIQGKSTLKSTNVAESSLRSTNASSFSLRSVPSNVKTEYPTPGNAIVIDEQTGSPYTLSTGESYVIRDTYTGELVFPGEGNVGLYIEGTWNNTSSAITLQDQTKFIVQNGGEFKTNVDLTINGYKFVIVAIGVSGKLNGDIKNITFNLTDDGQIINNGSFSAYQMALPSSAVFYNAGDAEIDKLTVNSTNNITNDKLLTISEANLTNGAIANNCNLVITNLTTAGTTISLSEGSLLSIATYSSITGTTINMDSHSMMEVLNSITFGSWANTINGIGEKTALVKLEKIISNGWRENGVKFKGNIEIENSDYTSPNGNNGYVLENPASWVEKGESDVVIPATECNDGGNNNVAPGTPANPVFPIIFDGTTLTYLFEDNWPYLGDYDMNDLVLDVKPAYSVNAANKVIQLQLEVTLRAAGATKRLAAGLQLDGINPGVVNSIARSNNAGINGNVFNQSNGLEPGQTYAVIPLFDDVHEALGHSSPLMTNTIKGSENNKPPRQVTFTIDFNNPLDLASISVDKFNVFIVNSGYKSKRNEIHMAGFVPTDKVDSKKFDAKNIKSRDNPYISTENLIWGLAIPGPAKYPVEWTSIRLAYPGLETWATSGGSSGKDWYKNSNENRIYDK